MIENAPNIIIIGQTGSGKSSLIKAITKKDVKVGHGCAVPHEICLPSDKLNEFGGTFHARTQKI